MHLATVMSVSFYGLGQLNLAGAEALLRGGSVDCSLGVSFKTSIWGIILVFVTIGLYLDSTLQSDCG